MKLTLSALFLRQDIYNTAQRAGISREVARKLADSILTANIEVSVTPEGETSGWKLTGIGVVKSLTITKDN